MDRKQIKKIAQNTKKGPTTESQRSREKTEIKKNTPSKELQAKSHEALNVI